MQSSRWISRLSFRAIALSGASSLLWAFGSHAAFGQQKPTVRQSSTSENWTSVEQTLGRKGAMNPG